MAMAYAYVSRAVNLQSSGTVDMIIELSMFGADVPDGSADLQGPFTISARVPISNSATQVETAIQAAIQAVASAKGLTVANGDLFISGLSKI
jgi:hypothetical protein